MGRVCLTGDPDEVRRLGLVVQRQPEILLEEAALLRPRLLHERAVDDCGREVFGAVQDVTGEPAVGRYTALHASTGRPERLVERCSALVDRLGERHGAEARCGIGEPDRGVAGVRASYRDAAPALRAGPRLEPDSRVFAVADLRVPQLVASVVRHERARYAAPVLAGLREHEDWPVGGRR